MTGIRVAAVQFELKAEDSLDTFLEHLESFVRKAVAAEADVVVFPELASTGLLASITDHEVTTETTSSDYWEVLPTFFEPIAAAVEQMARDHGIEILAGSHIRKAPDGSLRNTAILAHSDGRIDLQDKIHLTPPEHALGIRGGDQLVVTDIGRFTVGVLICADIQFPELSRYLVARGVDLILCPSLTWNRRGVHRVRTGCEARAIENQLYVVMSPLFGTDHLPADAPMHAVGQALVTAPVDRTIGLNDGIVGQTPSTSEQMLIVDLDHDLLGASRARPEAPGLQLQRPDLYRKLLAETDR